MGPWNHGFPYTFLQLRVDIMVVHLGLVMEYHYSFICNSDHNSPPEPCGYCPESVKILTETGFCWIFESAIVKPRVL